MTTPSERRRALRWGHEALLAIGEDAGAPGSLRSQAMTLAAAYPSLRELGTSFLELSAEELNQRLNVLVQTKALLVQAIRCDGLSAATRRNVIVTDRHFVEAHEINIKSQDTDDQRNAAKQWVDSICCGISMPSVWPKSCALMKEGDGLLVYPDKLIRVRLRTELAVPAFVEKVIASAAARDFLFDKLKTSAGQVGISGAEGLSDILCVRLFEPSPIW